MAARLMVRVRPGAKVAGLIGRMSDGAIQVRVTEPAREGRANQALEILLARRLGLSRSALKVVRGQTSRTKVIEVQGLDAEELARRLDAALATDGKES
jgi:uncharacterized protein YggU (UPF0235/DUF167 family)